MGTGIPPGVPVPYDGGGGRRRKRRRGGVLKAVRDLLVCAFVAFGIVLAVFAAPLLLGFDPVDAADFVNAPGFSKIDAFKNGWRNQHGISTMTFSHDGKSVTFTNDNGTLSEPSGNGTESDIQEARRILREWGLDK